VGAGNDATSACDPTGRDVWYKFTLCSTTTVTMDTGGSAIDTALALYPGCGAAEITCNDDCLTCLATGTASCIGPITLGPGHVTCGGRWGDRRTSWVVTCLDLAKVSPRMGGPSEEVSTR